MSGSQDTMHADIDAERAAHDLAARRMWAARELELQDGVASRAQLILGGYTPNDIRRAIRRREMQAAHRGVYVTHTGPLTWRQRAWAAVLYAEPAALCGPSVLEPKHTSDAAGPIHVAIDHARRLVPPPGIVVHRTVGLSRQIFAADRPPRLKLEDNALLQARVERAHGLPTGTRQSVRLTANGKEFRDVEYEAYGLVVELDGRLNHESWRAQGRDTDRDLDDLALGDRLTARVRWPQVFETQCRTAARVSQLLHRRGWKEDGRKCGDECDLDTWI